jgi:thymidylate kinase
MKGKLLVLEGPDGAGKTTALQSLMIGLADSGQRATNLAFPGRNPETLGELIYRVHHDSKSLGIPSITPTALQALHIAAHLDAIESTIIPILRGGTTVVLDRFWWSTWVYGKLQGVSEEVLHHLIAAEKSAWGNFHPNHVFLLERVHPLRSDAKEDWGRLSFEYGEIADREKQNYPVHRIANESSVDAVVAEMLQIVAT